MCRCIRNEKRVIGITLYFTIARLSCFEFIYNKENDICLIYARSGDGYEWVMKKKIKIYVKMLKRSLDKYVYY